MWAMGGGEAALLALAVAAIGWLRRSIVIELIRPIRIGPFMIRLRSEHHLAGRSTPAVVRTPGNDRQNALRWDDQSPAKANGAQHRPRSQRLSARADCISPASCREADP
jgi:hypothetical protein